VPFLVHMTSPKGIAVDPSKVRDVLDWKPPKFVHQVKFSWVGGLLLKVHSKLLKDCEACLMLKKLLTTSSVLVLPDITKFFDIYCDASGTGLGCVLMQEGRVISFSSRQLRCHEKY
jgi:hypothetical protein